MIEEQVETPSDKEGKKGKNLKRKSEKAKEEEEVEELKRLRRLKTKVELYKLRLQCLMMRGKNVDEMEPEDVEVRDFFSPKNEE